MPLTPGYGDTPLPDDELEALLPHIADLLERPISKAAIYDLEQAVREHVAEERLAPVLDGTLGLDELLNDFFLRDLPARLYAEDCCCRTIANYVVHTGVKETRRRLLEH